MGTMVDPDLHRKVARFGGGDLTACFNCGNCTAICPLSTESTSFPRKVIHYLQVGLTEKFRSSPEPWLCYYCGECSKSCPREANPGETMMAARRYLISEYDWSGIAKKIYLSKHLEVGAMVASSLFVILLFYFFHGPMVTARVELNTFAPVKWIELADHFMAAYIALFLLMNIFRMYHFIMGKGKENRMPLRVFLSELPVLFRNFATQDSLRKCDDSQARWLKHFLLMSGYVLMMVLIILFLPWFQTDRVYPFFHPQRLLGYYATAVLLYFTADFIVGRLKKKEEIHRFSRSSDWTFLILLFLMAFTGILVHIFRLSGYPRLTYYTYVVHLAVDAPWLLVVIPFGKWTHMI